MAVDQYRCCGTDFFVRIAIITLLVLFSGLMSGLTLGLMSMSLVDLEVLLKSGTPTDRKHAGINFLLLFVAIFINITWSYLAHTLTLLFFSWVIYICLFS